MDIIRNETTRAALAARSWLSDLGVADLAGTPALLVAGTLEGRRFSTYVGDRVETTRSMDADRVKALLNDMMRDPEVDNMVDADLVNEHLAHVLTMRDVEYLEFTPYRNGTPPTLDMIAPGIGRLSLMVDADPLEKRLARLRRNRQQDAEGRTISRFGAMSLALVAEDHDDLDRILDTAFVADDLTYRGVHMRITRSTHVLTTVRSGTMLVLPDGIEILDLPDTIKLALQGGQLNGAPLSQVADMPGFDDLRIGKINRQTSINRLTAGGGGGWIKIHVRDEHNATFEDLEIEDARRHAHETFDRRRAAMTEPGS